MSMSQAQEIVYSLLKEVGPTTDRDIHYTLNEQGVVVTESGVRHRRNQLTKKGYVRHSGKYATLPTGRKLTVWKAK